MSPAPDAHGHVTSIEQRDDDTLRVYVETDSFSPGQEVEVSVYLTQGNAYAAHYEKKYIPFSGSNGSKQPAVLHVELPATTLVAAQDLTVLTRVAEVWPSVMEQDPTTGPLGDVVPGNEYKGPKAVWRYKYPGKGPGDPGSPAPSNGGS